MDALFETLKKLGPARLGVMLLALLSLVVFFIFIAVRSSAPTMTLLYGDLSSSDSTAIAGRLDLAKIPFRLEQNGKEVMVAQQYVGKARMILAEDGLPSNGSIGYEIFDQKQRFGTTNFVQNINKLRALEGELARTIKTLDAVKTARVHLVLPQRELFSREGRPASASVFVNLRNSQQMDKNQALAIQHLVASAVSRLNPENVTIIDGNGTLLASGAGKNAGSAFSGNGEAMRIKYEQNLTKNIEAMIGRIVGYGKVQASVSADLDFDIISRNSESYDPEGQVVRSTQTVTEDETDNTGSQNNTVTVQNNLPGLPSAGGTDNNIGISSSRSEEVVNYEISKTIETAVLESGEVRKISVAVLVDGQYEDIPLAEDAEDDAVPEKRYIPRSQEELDKITTLVKSAVGYDELRGDTIEVVNMRFASIDSFEDTGDEELIFGLLQRNEIMQFAETLMLSIVALLVVLLVLRPLVNHVAVASQSIRDQKATETEKNTAMLASQVEEQAQLSAPNPGGEGDAANAISVQNVEGRVKDSSLRQVSELVDGNPSETVSVIRSWITQEN